MYFWLSRILGHSRWKWGNRWSNCTRERLEKWWQESEGSKDRLGLSSRVNPSRNPPSNVCSRSKVRKEPPECPSLLVLPTFLTPSSFKFEWSSKLNIYSTRSKISMTFTSFNEQLDSCILCEKEFPWNADQLGEFANC